MCLAVALALCSQAEAQTNEVHDSLSLHEVSIVGKSKARKMHEQAYAVSVVDLATKYQTASPLNKVLNTVTSVNIREDGGLGSNYSFSMNGFSGNQVKFFIDGIPMDNFGSSFNLATISANMADRIEVYKGVLPVSLGSDALGGAVNIVSRTNANYLDATYSVGSFNTHRAAVNGVYTSKAGFTFRANAFANYSDNDYEVWAPIVNLQTNKQEGEEWAKRFNDGYQSYGVKLETGVVRQSWADYLLVGMIASADKRNVQTGATMDAVYGGVKNRSWSLIPSIRYKKNDLLVPGLSLSLYGTYSMVNTYNVDTLARRYNWRGEWVNSTSAGEAYLTDATIRERQWQANANVSYVISDHHSLTLNNVFSAIRRKSNDAMYPDDEKAQKTALASIARYNELAKKGSDDDFGKAASRMWALEKGPFYADQFVCALLLVICGGLESDEDCHTFDADRNVIPGLYVAGNVQGSRFSHEYPITLKGVSHSLAMYYGYVAGQNAVDGI